MQEYEIEVEQEEIEEKTGKNELDIIQLAICIILFLAIFLVGHLAGNIIGIDDSSSDVSESTAQQVVLYEIVE